MGRILAIDYGQKRIGLAATDPQQIIANGITTIPTSEIWNFLKKYLEEEQVEKVVIGYPVDTNNSPSQALSYINPFLKKFCKTYPNLPIEQYDERFTSKMAFQTMIDAGLGKKARRNKSLVDKISATIILQSYMETLS